MLDANPRLSLLLSDTSTPVEGRIGLLDNVLDGAGTAPATADLLRQTVELLRGERADEAVLELAELAVARRGEVVAHVTAAGELSDEQTRRLTEILSRIYGHPVAVQFNVDPELMGGLLITVGDEVIDGAISSRLAAAAPDFRTDTTRPPKSLSNTKAGRRKAMAELTISAADIEGAIEDYVPPSPPTPSARRSAP